MCVIIYKPAGTKNPTDKVLQKCLESNKNGFGVMQREGDRILIKKGLFDIKEITRLVNRVPKSAEAAYHFRLATHGNISAANCHPFPISRFNEALRQTEGVFDSGLVHNGVIHDFTRSGIKQNDLNSLSDTMCLVKHLCRATKHRFIFDRFRKHIPDRYGKFIIFTPTFTYWFGTFYDDHGLRFSNTSYKDFNDVWGCNKGVNYSHALDGLDEDEKPINKPKNEPKPQGKELTTSQIGKLVDAIQKNKHRDFVDNRSIPPRHLSPIVMEVERCHLRFTNPAFKHIQNPEVEYFQLYGTAIQYRGRTVFVEYGASKESVFDVLAYIEEDMQEDGVGDRTASDIEANINRLNLFP